LNGIVGLETAFSLIYTHFVKTKKITWKRMIELMSINPARIFKLNNNEIKLKNDANFVICDINEKWIIDSSRFKSKSHVSPFNKWSVFAKVKQTIVSNL
jgi:dihydroorotase